MEKVNIKACTYLALLHILAMLGIRCHAASAIITAVALYLLTGIGVTIGYHRLLTHRSFTPTKWLRFLSLFWGAMAGQGGPLYWVAIHRLHHKFTDCKKDPHDAARGFLWSHVGWTMVKTKEIVGYANEVEDLTRDPYLMWLENNSLYLQWLIVTVIVIVLYVFRGHYQAISTLAWAYGVRTVLVLHASWLTNSAAHMWGYKRYNTKDNSRNNWIVAVLTFGAASLLVV